MFSICRVRLLESAFRQQCAILKPLHTTVALETESLQQPKTLPKGYRPPGAFAVFFKECRRNAGSSDGVSMKEAAAKWGMLSQAEKDGYKAEGIQIGKGKEAEFRSKVIAEQNELVEKSQQKRREQKQRSRRLEIRKYNEQTNHPKKPANSFSLFVREKFQSVGKSTDRHENNQVIYAAAAEWKNMSESDKKPYIAQGKALNEQYKADLEKWKELHYADRPKKVVKVVRASRVAAKKARARQAAPKASKKARSSTKSKKTVSKKP